MKSLAALVGLVALFACGAPADGSSPMDGADAAPATASPKASSDAHFAPVSAEGSPFLASAPVATVAPAPSPAAASDAAPSPEARGDSPAPSPAAAHDTPAPASEATPDPTPEHPLVIDCRQDDCAACSADLRETHPDWYESGAASCQLRSCSADSDCGSLGSDLVCLPFVAGGSPVCRLPRLHELQTCDESVRDACEIGLLCSAGRCRKL